MSSIDNEQKTMDTQSKPKISATISLSSSTHSYTSSQPPSLNLILTSHHPTPVTVYADDLSPSLMLACGAFTITSLTTGSIIKQSRRTHCRIPPPTKVAVPLLEDLFHTLLPHTPTTLSAPFSRSRKNTSGKPLAKDDPEYGNDPSARHGACGVDGLEAGEDYVLQLAGDSRVPWNTVRWWKYGTKEEVLHPEDAEEGLDGRKVRFGAGPHEAIVVDSTAFKGLSFKCVE